MRILYGGREATATLTSDARALWVSLDKDPGYGRMAFDVPITPSVVFISDVTAPDARTIAGRLIHTADFIGHPGSKQWHLDVASDLLSRFA